MPGSPIHLLDEAWGVLNLFIRQVAHTLTLVHSSPILKQAPTTWTSLYKGGLVYQHLDNIRWIMRACIWKVVVRMGFPLGAVLSKILYFMLYLGQK